MKPRLLSSHPCPPVVELTAREILRVQQFPTPHRPRRRPRRRRSNGHLQHRPAGGPRRPPRRGRSPTSRHPKEARRRRPRPNGRRARNRAQRDPARRRRRDPGPASRTRRRPANPACGSHLSRDRQDTAQRSRRRRTQLRRLGGDGPRAHGFINRGINVLVHALVRAAGRRSARCRCSGLRWSAEAGRLLETAGPRLERTTVLDGDPLAPSVSPRSGRAARRRCTAAPAGHLSARRGGWSRSTACSSSPITSARASAYSPRTPGTRGSPCSSRKRAHGSGRITWMMSTGAAHTALAPAPFNSSARTSADEDVSVSERLAATARHKIPSPIESISVTGWGSASGAQLALRSLAGRDLLVRSGAARCSSRLHLAARPDPVFWRRVMSALLVGYARCSTDQQDLTAQRDGLLGLGVEAERVYVDHGLTGPHRERPGLREALAACRAVDTLVVTKLDRLARSLRD